MTGPEPKKRKRKAMPAPPDTDAPASDEDIAARRARAEMIREQIEDFGEPRSGPEREISPREFTDGAIEKSRKPKQR